MIVPDHAIGWRLDKWLQDSYPHIPYHQWARALRKGNVRLNKKRATGSERLQPQDFIRFPPENILENMASGFVSQGPLIPKKKKPVSNRWLSALESWILYEDKDLLVLNKPAGLATQGGTKQNTHLDGILEAFGKTKGQNFHLVHRLDKDTSGVLLVAKNPSTATALGNALKNHLITKTYLALIQGVLRPLDGEINAPLYKNTKDSKEKMEINDLGKPAFTRYQTAAYAGKKASCVILSPETGRTHQLRVHLASQGCPILGDGKYGGQSARWTNIPKNLYLHAWHIAFNHPVSQKRVSFSAPIPEHMKMVLDFLGFAEPII